MFSENLNYFKGTEAIDFQLQSPLARSLTEIYQEVITYRDNLDYSNMKESDRRAFRTDTVTDYVKKTTNKKVIAAIKKETGVELKDIVGEGGVNFGISLAFAIDLSMDNLGAACETLERQSATGNTKYVPTRKIVDEMREMSDLLDLKTGRLSSDKYGKKRTISATMYFDINSAFLVQDFLPSQKCEPLTAAEIAAIVTHEVGHLISMVEHATDMYAAHRRITDHIRSLKTHEDPSEIIDVLNDHVRPLLVSLKKKGTGDNIAIDTVITIIDKIYNIRTEADDSGWLVAGGIVWHALVTVSVLALNIIFLMYYGWLSASALEIVKEVMFVNKNSSGGKASDTKTTYRNSYLIERRADAFVARHGLSVNLVGALSKIHTYAEYASFGTVFSNTLRHNTLFNMYMTLCVFILRNTSIGFILDPIGYENQYQRAFRALQEHRAVFKDGNIPPSVLRVWLSNAVQLETELKEIKGMRDTKLGKSIQLILKSLVSPIMWYKLIKDGNLTGDYERLHDSLDELDKNSLYQHASKISLL